MRVNTLNGFTASVQQQCDFSEREGVCASCERVSGSVLSGQSGGGVVSVFLGKTRVAQYKEH